MKRHLLTFTVMTTTVIMLSALSSTYPTVDKTSRMKRGVLVLIPQAFKRKRDHPPLIRYESPQRRSDYIESTRRRYQPSQTNDEVPRRTSELPQRRYEPSQYYGSTSKYESPPRRRYESPPQRRYTPSSEAITTSEERRYQRQPIRQSEYPSRYRYNQNPKLYY